MARNSPNSARPPFAGSATPKKWLERNSIHAALTMSVRVALRELPKSQSQLRIALDKSEQGRVQLRPPEFSVAMLSTFRALAVAWASAKYPQHRRKLQVFARQVQSELDPLLFGERDAFHLAHAAAYAAEHNKNDAVAAAEFALSNDGVNREDAIFISDSNLKERPSRAVELAARPLWPTRTPAWARAGWLGLKNKLLQEDENWNVWIEWYEDRVAGRPSLGEAFDIAIATLPDELWQAGAAALNARVNELIAEYTSPEPIPAQGAGPQFGLNADLKITLAPSGELDPAGNNLRRISQLLPLVRQAADDLANHLNPNIQPLSGNVSDYRATISAEPNSIPWGTVFGLGVRLENAALAARREIADRLHEPLEDAAQEALDSVLALHGPLILATAEGRELTEEADRFSLTRAQQALLRTDSTAVAEALMNSPEIIERSAAELGEKAAESIGQGDHPERGSVFGLATVKNVTTVLVSAGTLAAFVPAGMTVAGVIGGAAAGGIAWVGYEALKKSQRFTAATSALGAGFDRLHEMGEERLLQRLVGLSPFRRFVVTNEEPLRRIAQNSTQLRWMSRYIDFIVQTSPDKR